MLTSALVSFVILAAIGGIIVYGGRLTPDPFNKILSFVGWILIILAVLNFVLALLNHAPVFSL